MWRFVHISTLKKNAGSTKAYPPQTQGNFNARRERIDLPSKKSHTFKKNHSVRKRKHSDCPFACQTATAFSALMSLLYRPHAHRRDISLLATADFHASSRFFCRDFLGFLFVLPILEPSLFLLRAQHASETGYIFNVLSFVRDRQTVTVSVRYFRH